MTDLTIITGASSNHFNCLLNLIGSIKHYEPKVPIVVYDLGLGEEEIALVKALAPVQSFDHSLYPAWIDIRAERGQCAWKPIDALDEIGGIVLWLDAGNLLLSNLDNVHRILDKTGILTPASSGTIDDWTHPAAARRRTATAQSLVSTEGLPGLPSLPLAGSNAR